MWAENCVTGCWGGSMTEQIRPELEDSGRTALF
jgi:hypothetical protein